MTTPRIEEMVEEFNDMLARNWGEKSSIYEVLSTGREKDWLRTALTQDRASLHTSLVAAVEELKEDSETPFGTQELHETELAYNQALDDTLTIINSIFKE